MIINFKLSPSALPGGALPPAGRIHTAPRNLLCMCLLCFGLSAPFTTYAAVIDGVEGLGGDELSGHVWNFASRAEFNGLSASMQFDNGIYRENIGDRCDFFKLTGDSLMWTGYNMGRRMGILPERPVFAGIFNVCRMSTVVSGVSPENPASSGSERGYVANGLLDGSYRLLESGIIHGTLMNTGSAIVSPGDTVYNVTLSRTVHTYTVPRPAVQHKCDANDMAVNGDSITAGDTISTVTYRWFAGDRPMPIAVQRDRVLFVNSRDVELDSPGPDTGADVINPQDISDILKTAAIACDNNRVTVTIFREMDVYAYIVDGIGNIYSSCRCSGSSLSMDIASLPHNTYILTIVSEQHPECSHKLLLNL